MFSHAQLQTMQVPNQMNFNTTNSPIQNIEEYVQRLTDAATNQLMQNFNLATELLAVQQLLSLEKQASSMKLPLLASPLAQPQLQLQQPLQLPNPSFPIAAPQVTEKLSGKRKRDEETVKKASAQRERRLAKSRITAKERRKKKKVEVGGLKSEVLSLQIENETLKKKLEALPEDKKNKIKEAFNEQKGSYKKGCVFCSASFLKPKELVRHYEVSHSLEAKAMIPGDKELNLTTLSSPELALSIMEKQIRELLLHVSTGEKITPDMDEETKKQIRLAKNAQSARLCRLRKKLGIQVMRLQIPIFTHENEILKKFLNVEK